MKAETIERLALERMVKLSVELEVQLDRSPKTQPVMAVLSLAREQAAQGMSALVYEDPRNADKIRELQHEVRRYDDLVAWLHKILVDGKEADRRIDELERQEFNEILLDPELQAERDHLRGERTQED